MSRELVISVSPGEWRAGLFAEGDAVELMVERDERASLVGSVHFGRVLRVLPALPGAFIDIDQPRPAFLPKPGGLTEGAGIVVQVVKDAFEDKAPEVSTAIELAGRHLVWTPQRPGIALRRGMAPAERARLSAALAPLLHEGEGVALRGQPGEPEEAALQEDILRLRAEHAALRRAARTATRPRRLDSPQDPLERIVAALAGEAERVLVDDRPSLPRLRALHRAVEPIAPDSDRIEALDEAIATALAGTVPLPEGAHLRVEAGVAFTAIDVDLGSAAGGRRQAAEAIRRVNLAAADRLGRELRRRGIGGAIVADFVSMSERAHRQDVEAVLAAAVAADPAGVQLHGWTRLGHFELTRRRVRPSLAELMLCAATDRRAKTPVTVGLEVLRLFGRQNWSPGGITARVHPDVASALAGPLGRHVLAAQDRTGQRLSIAADPARPGESFDLAPA